MKPKRKGGKLKKGCKILSAFGLSLAITFGIPIIDVCDDLA